MTPLEDLAQTIATCTQCPLHESRTHAVAGKGPASADVVFVGEAPGQHEDEQGEPFVGRSGEMLDNLLDLGGIARSSVFVTNTLKCRPPQNRFPEEPAPHICTGYLRKQLAIIQPLVVVLLGARALTHLLLPDTGVMVDKYNAFVGRWFRRRDQWAEMRFVTLYHPAFLLRNKSPYDEELCVATLTAVAQYIRARQTSAPPPAVEITDLLAQPPHMIQPRNLFRQRKM